MTAAQGASAGPPAAAAAGRARTYRWAIAVLALAQLMFLLDATIVNVALPSIERAMRMSGPGLEWTVSAYSVPFGGLLLLGGRAGDILGRRRVFIGGLTLFTAASLLGGLAQAPWWLLVCRAAQGTGAAAAYPAALALITATFPDGKQRHRAIGTFAVIAGTGSAIGPLAGGVIITYLSWRWVLFVNVPIGLFLLIATPRALPETAATPGRFDVAGALSVTTGVMLAIYALIAGAAGEGGRSHWGSPAVLACLAGAAAALITFVIVERRSRRPLVPLRIFADRGRAGCYVVAIALNTSMFGVLFFMTLFVQGVWGYSPLRTGVVYLPLAVLLLAGTWAGGRLVTRTGVRLLLLSGLAVGAAGMAWLSRIGPAGSYAGSLLLPNVLTYGGIGLASVPLTATAVAGVAAAESGLASGLFSAARQVGGAAGLAVLGTVTWTAVAGREAAGAGTRPALADGIDRGFLVAAAVMALALIVAAATNPHHRQSQPPRRTGGGAAEPAPGSAAPGAGEPAGSQPPLTVLCITGWCRNGSTIIGNILGEIPGFFHVGELHFLWKNSAGLGANSVCGCGKPLTECAIWLDILAAGRPAGVTADAHADAVIARQQRYVRTRHTWRVLRRGLRSPGIAEHAALMTLTYHAIAERTGARILVDTNKIPGESALLPHLDGVRPYYVHLVRDPRAVAKSWHQPKEYAYALPASKAAAYWLGFNLAARALTRRYPERSMFLRYEDFIADPATAVDALLAFVGADTGGNPVRDRVIELRTNHTVTGNPDRLHTGATLIRDADDSWRNGLPWQAKLTAVTLSWPLFRRYGYRYHGTFRSAAGEGRPHRGAAGLAGSPQARASRRGARGPGA